MERSLFIIKPDAVERGLAGRILSAVEAEDMRVIAVKMVKLSSSEAGDFYRVHKGKEFYNKLISYMSSGRCIVGVVEGEDAIRRLREICGATDPSIAPKNTIRGAFGINVTMNSIHASDSLVSAAEEVPFFFPDID